MKKKMMVSAIAIALVFALGIGFLFGASECFSNWKTDTWFGKTESKIQPNDDLSFIPHDTENMKLAVGKMTTASAENGYTKSVTLTATVYPEDVPDKSVDWTIEWFDQTITLTLADYVAIAPESDGSLTATVTCKKPFNHDVLITVTSRVGKISANCRVIYEGAPTSVEIVGNGISATSHAGIGSYYGLYTGKTCTFDLTANNEFGDVRTDCAYTFEVSAVGNLVVQDQKYYGTTNTHTWIEGTEKTIPISSIENISTTVNMPAFTCSIAGSTLSIKANATLIQHYASSSRVGQTATYFGRFKAYENDNWYFTVTVTETNSGVSQTVKLRPIASVNAIGMDNNLIAF